MAPGDFMANTPLEFLLEGSNVRLDMLYLVPGAPVPEAIPDHDLAFVAVGESDENQVFLRALEPVVRGWPRPVLNAPERIAHLSAGEPPLHEPGLAELIRSGVAAGTLTFTADVAASSQADVVWICHDTPVDEEDNADSAAVLSQTEMLFPHLRDGAVVLVSAQLPVGSVAALEHRFAAHANGRAVSFAFSR